MNEEARARRVHELVLEAGELHLAHAARRQELDVRQKGRVDLVTEADDALQRLLVEGLRRDFPGERVVAEEGELSAAASAEGPVWYVDPIDGTTNFVHGHPFSCISVGLWVDGRPELGVVHAPEQGELFRARRGSGAWLERRGDGDPRPLRVSGRTELRSALLATGYPYERGPLTRLNLAVTAHFLGAARGVRRAGSAALDLCWVAASRLDGFWEFALSPWDVAAGIAIAREAGATVSDFEGTGEDLLHARRLLATTPGIHEECLRTLAIAHENPELDCLAPPLTAPVARRGPLPGDGP